MLRTRSLSKENLFDEFNAGKDIKLSILSYLSENEIHWLVSNVSTEWNLICKSTFNDSRFHYTFCNYFDKLIKLHINQQINKDLNENKDENITTPSSLSSDVRSQTSNSNSSATTSSPNSTQPTNANTNTNTNTNTTTNTKTNNKNSDTDLNEILTVKLWVECPWNRKWCYGKITNIDRKGITVKVITKDHNPLSQDMDSSMVTHENELYFANKNGNKQNNKQNNNNNNSNSNNKIEYYFGDGYHHIAPINTLDKYKTLNIGTKVSMKNLIINSIETGKQVDYFQRPLIDVHASFTRKHLLWKGKHSDLDDLGRVFNGDTWLCGIIDINALNFHFPNWDNDKNNENYQIPVTIDITGVIFRESHWPFDEYYSQFYNVYKYGNNRYFTQIWIDSNKITKLLAPFGTKTAKVYQQELLCTPAMNTKGIGVSNFEFMEESRLTLYDIYYNYCIDLSLDSNYNHYVTSNIIPQFGELEKRYPNKVLVVMVNNGQLFKGILYKLKNKHNLNGKSPFEVGIMYNSQDLTDHHVYDISKKLILFDEKYLNIDNDDNNYNQEKLDKHLKSIIMYDYFRLNTSYERPIINFDLSSLVNQYDINWKTKMEQNRANSSSSLNLNLGNNNSNINSNLNNNNSSSPSSSSQLSLSMDSNDSNRKVENIGCIPINVSKECVEYIDALLECPNLSREYQANVLYCKPKFMTLFDSEWDHDNWSKLTKECYEIVYKKCYTICIQEWKIGVIFFEKFKTRQDMIYFIYDTNNQFHVFIDVTNEFNTLQNRLKQDWLDVKRKELVQNQSNMNNDIDLQMVQIEKQWDDRKYFIEAHTHQLFFNQKKNRVFWKAFVHLDSNEILPYYL